MSERRRTSRWPRGRLLIVGLMPMGSRLLIACLISAPLAIVAAQAAQPSAVQLPVAISRQTNSRPAASQPAASLHAPQIHAISPPATVGGRAALRSTASLGGPASRASSKGTARGALGNLNGIGGLNATAVKHRPR